MADHSYIEWTDATWNPITGCSVVSPGCTNCYAMKLAGTRLAHHPSREGLTRDTKAGPVWTGEVRFNAQWLTQPLRWKRPRMIFVCAHGDLFHESVPDEWIDKVFAVMALAPQHVFQILTKRSARMRKYMLPTTEIPILGRLPLERIHFEAQDDGEPWDTMKRFGNLYSLYCSVPWPLPNVWLGVSAEDQTRADERIPDLLATPAAVRWISYEPALGPIDFTRIDDGERDGTRMIFDALSGVATCGEDMISGVFGNPDPRIDWIVGGRESGPSARTIPTSTFRSTRDQCAAAGVPYFHKQNGEWIDADEWFDLVARNQPIKVCDAQSVFSPWLPHRPLNFDDAARLADITGQYRYEHQSDGSTLIRVGKKAAGRLLDAVEHNAMPEVRR